MIFSTVELYFCLLCLLNVDSYLQNNGKAEIIVKISSCTSYRMVKNKKKIPLVLDLKSFVTAIGQVNFFVP